MMTRVFFLLNAAFAMAILDLMLSSDITPPKQAIYSIQQYPVVFYLSQRVQGMVALRFSLL
jgi:hypothetical protein